MCYEFGLIWGLYLNNYFDIFLVMFIYVVVVVLGKIIVIDMYWIWQEGNQCLIKELFEIKGGLVQVLEKLGLGVEIDMD